MRNLVDRPKFKRGPREKPVPFGKAGRHKTPQQQGRDREAAIAKDLGGDRVPGSGCFAGRGGDVLLEKYLIESKLTKSLSYSISIRTLRKIKLEAAEARRRPILVLELSGGQMFEEERWAMMPYEDFKRLIES
jgi:hypothetical protein